MGTSMLRLPGRIVQMPPAVAVRRSLAVSAELVIAEVIAARHLVGVQYLYGMALGDRTGVGAETGMGSSALSYEMSEISNALQIRQRIISTSRSFMGAYPYHWARC